MNVSMKRSLFTTIIYGVLFLFLVIYFIAVGPEKFIEIKIHQVVCAVAFLTALASFFLMLLFTRKKSDIIDERDAFIQKRANTAGLLISLIYVFLLSIILFTVYRNEKVLSVSWMWFIAYSSFAFGYFITSLSHLYLCFYEG